MQGYVTVSARHLHTKIPIAIRTRLIQKKKVTTQHTRLMHEGSETHVYNVSGTEKNGKGKTATLKWPRRCIARPTPGRYRALIKLIHVAIRRLVRNERNEPKTV